VSDEDSQLALSCVERGWRYSRLDEDAFLFEERSEYLARGDERIVRILPRAAAVMGSTSAEGGSLSAVLAGLARQSLDAELPGIGAGADVDASSTSVVSLSLLGARIDVRCAHPACAAGIAAFYSASTVPGASSSPEVVIWCDWEDSGRYLFRARPEDHAGVPLEGVFIQTLRSAQVPWTWTLPPIPPLASWPFKDRFAALHAATVCTAAGEGVLIAGDRGSGKSTTALRVSERLGAHVSRRRLPRSVPGSLGRPCPLTACCSSSRERQRRGSPGSRDPRRCESCWPTIGKRDPRSATRCRPCCTLPHVPSPGRSSSPSTMRWSTSFATSLTPEAKPGSTCIQAKLCTTLHSGSGGGVGKNGCSIQESWRSWTVQRCQCRDPHCRRVGDRHSGRPTRPHAGGGTKHRQEGADHRGERWQDQCCDQPGHRVEPDQ